MWVALIGVLVVLGLVQEPQGEPAAGQAQAKTAAAALPEEGTVEALAKYNELREKAKHTADAQWKLAIWCEEHGLHAESYAHLTEVVRLDPKRLAAWHKLGYQKRNGHWLTDEQIQQLETERKLGKEWAGKLTKLHKQYHDSKGHAEAVEALSKIEDPEAALPVYREFAARGPADQSLVIQLLGQIKGPKASKALAMLAVYGSTPEVRRRAVETLRGRDPAEFVELLVELMVKPLRYEVRLVRGPGSPGAIFVEGEQFNVRRIYAPPPPPLVGIGPGDYVGYDEFGLPAVLSRLAPPAGSMSIGFGAPGSGTAAAPGPNAARVAGLVGRGGAALPNNAGAPAATASGFSFSNQQALLIPVGQNRLLAAQGAAAAQQQLEGDVQVIESYNEIRRRFNKLVGSVLKEALGEEPGDDRDAWKKWLSEKKGYEDKPEKKVKPTLSEIVPLAVNPPFFNRLVMALFPSTPPDN